MELGAAAAAGAAATASGVGLGLFNYNRGNYMMDQKLHWGRFNAMYAMAIAQMGQYRQDITDVTGLTAGRMHIFCDIAALTGTIATALFCPGRLGLHTPAPPGWLMGLFLVNLAGTYIFLALTIWLGMHASLRSDSAATHMLTRFVRLPTPAQWMLDRARKFLSSFEEQSLKDVLRVPFMRHQYPGRGVEGGFNEGMEVDPDADRRRRHGTDVPGWFRKEMAIDHGYTVESMMPYSARGTAPEHFEVLREVQSEWWPYDVYCRLCLFLAFMHLTHAWTYMQIGHHLQETRSVFAAFCVVMPLSVVQQVILSLDIVPKAGDFPIHHIGPFAQVLAYVAAAIEYRPSYSQPVANFGYALVYLAYIIHIIYTAQLFRLCTPDQTKAPQSAEAPAAAWWPGEWRLPSSFYHAVWLVAPPRQLEPGQNDLVGEIRSHSRGNAARAASGWKGLTADAAAEKRRDVHMALGRQGESPAWTNVKFGLGALVVAWAVLILGFSIEIANQGTGHPSLLSAPGLPNHLRDPRYRPIKPWHTERTEVGTGGVLAGPAKNMHEDAIERRLAEASEVALTLASGRRQELANKLRSILPALHELATSASQEAERASSNRFGILPAQPSPASAKHAQVKVQWPPMFEPRVLACAHGAAESSGSLALALSHYGRGTIINASGEVTPFFLEGAFGHGSLLSASWDEHGLLLVTASGATLECPGTGPNDSRWSCSLLQGAELPLGSTKPFRGAVAVIRAPQQEGAKAKAAALQAVVAYPDDSAVTLFTRAAKEKATWLPAGEVRTHTSATCAAFIAGKEELLLTSGDGAVARMHMDEGSVVAAAAGIEGFATHEWPAMCGLPSGRVVRLAVGRKASGMIREPALFMG